MGIALFSDVHSNLPGLEVVLADLGAAGVDERYDHRVSSVSAAKKDRGSFQDLALDPEGPVLAPQPSQLDPLVGRQAGLLAGVDGRLADVAAEASYETPGSRATDVAVLPG